MRELIRLRNDLRCADGVKQVEALKFAVHFIGDIHQPLHIVLEAKGGNDIPVRLVMHGRRECSGKCDPIPSTSSFHEAWDSGLIHQTVWDWGDYVDQLEKGWLSTEEAHKPNIDGGTPEEWANQTHKAAQEVWTLLPSEAPLDDAYYKKIEPILDRQLGLGGLRLARFLNDAFVSNVCPVQ